MLLEKKFLFFKSAVWGKAVVQEDQKHRKNTFLGRGKWYLKFRHCVEAIVQFKKTNKLVR